MMFKNTSRGGTCRTRSCAPCENCTFQILLCHVGQHWLAVEHNTMALCSVSVSQNSTWSSCDPSIDNRHCYGEFCILGIGRLFKYVIPSFDVLLRLYNTLRSEMILNFHHVYPMWMKAMDVCLLEKCDFGQCVYLEGLDLPPRLL